MSAAWSERRTCGSVGGVTLFLCVATQASLFLAQEDERRRDQGEAARAVLLQLGAAVAQAAEAMEAHGPDQGVAAFALVQLGRGLAA